MIFKRIYWMVVVFAFSAIIAGAIPDAPRTSVCSASWTKRVTESGRKRWRHVYIHPNMNIQNALFQVKPYMVVHFTPGEYKRSPVFRIPSSNIIVEGACQQAVLHSPLTVEGNRDVMLTNLMFDGRYRDRQALINFGKPFKPTRKARRGGGSATPYGGGTRQILAALEAARGEVKGIKRNHAQQKSVTAAPATPIPLPEPEATQLKQAAEEYQQKLAQLNAQYDPLWKLIIARAAQRAKLSPEQSDALTVKPVLDAKNNVLGYQWVTPEPPKPPVKEN